MSIRVIREPKYCGFEIMNDLSQPFIVPRPEVGWWRRRARALRRALLLRRMRNATAPERKDWNY